MATLGNATQPSGTSFPAAGTIYLQRVQAASNETLQSVEVWLSAANQNWAERIFCIYSDNAGAPDALIAQSSAFFGTPDYTMAQFTRAVAASLTSGTFYWIGVQFEHDSSTIASETSTGFTGYRNYSAGFGSLPANLTGGTTDANTRYGISGTTLSGASIDSYPATVRSGDTGVAYTTTGLSTVSSITIGSLAGTSISDTAGDGTHSVPALTDGVAHELYGTKTVTITGTGGTPTTSTSFQPLSTQSFVTLSGTLNTTDTGVLYSFSPAAAVGDQIVWTTANGTVDAQGNYTGDFTGTQTMWHIDATDNVARSYSVITGVGNKILKYWNGSAWVEKPLKYWNGSAWVAKTIRYWNGSAWS